MEIKNNKSISNNLTNIELPRKTRKVYIFLIINYFAYIIMYIPTIYSIFSGYKILSFVFAVIEIITSGLILGYVIYAGRRNNV